jgi:hypothetical protein
MVNINWQFQTMIAGGPAFIINQPAIQVDAYDVAAVTVPQSGSVAVQIQPSSTAGDVVFLVVTSSQYPGITYTVDALAPVYALDGPHTLVGSGAVAFLTSTAPSPAPPPQKLTFNNTLAKSVNVQVVVGRKVP